VGIYRDDADEDHRNLKFYLNTPCNFRLAWPEDACNACCFSRHFIKMNWKVLAVAIIGLLLKNSVPYASSISIAVILIIIGKTAIQMIKIRRRFSRLVHTCPIGIQG
jgi:hypothetical protein